MTNAFRPHVSSAVIGVDASKKITLFTPEAASLTGVTAEKALGHSVEVLPQELREVLARTLSTHQAFSLALKINRPAREALPLLVSASPTLDQNGKTSGAVVVLQNASDAKKFEENFARLNRLASIGALSASMAHEIKNALVAVRTFVELLLNRNREDELAEIVAREMARIDSIVSQILKFSGPAKPTLAALRLHDVLNRALRLAEEEMAKKGITLEKAFAESDLIKGDDYQLQQAFLNLIFNALEATASGGHLLVKTEWIGERGDTPDALRETAPPQFRVTIRDTGVGIAPENLGRVFEPFFTTKPKGTGLGLPITRRIIQEHRGSISVESDLKKGTAFYVLFPVGQS